MKAAAFALVSANLPIGGFSYSQALETACAEGLVHDRESFSLYLAGNLKALSGLDLPLLNRLFMVAEKEADFSALASEIKAYRVTAELRTEEVQKGRALARLMGNLFPDLPETLLNAASGSYLAAFALFAKWRGLTDAECLFCYAFAYLEGQCMAAIKTVPLGQNAAWQIISEQAARLDGLCEQAVSLPISEIGAAQFNQTILSMKHERQYSRIFRS